MWRMSFLEHLLVRVFLLCSVVLVVVAVVLPFAFCILLLVVFLALAVVRALSGSFELLAFGSAHIFVYLLAPFELVHVLLSIAVPFR